MFAAATVKPVDDEAPSDADWAAAAAGVAVLAEVFAGIG